MKSAIVTLSIVTASLFYVGIASASGTRAPEAGNSQTLQQSATCLGGCGESFDLPGLIPTDYIAFSIKPHVGSPAVFYADMKPH
jgi:hypothetical protein